MQKKISQILLALGLFSSLQEPKLFGVLNYETYLESWDSSWNTALTGMPPTPATASTTYDNVTLNISFASYTFPGLNGLQFSNTTTDTNTVISYVEGQNGRVKISYGGASYAGPNYFISQTSGWPNNIPDLVSGVSSVVNSYGFAGVDFDIEDTLPSNTTAQEFADQLFSFLTQVRQALPNKILSLTIPGQGWGTYWEYLAKQVAAANTVDCISFMEYDIWIGAGSYSAQIEADITTYTSPVNTAPAPNYAPGWGIPKNMVQLGLMPGNDDVGNFLSVDDAKLLSEFAVSTGLYGVMTWDIDRDSGTNPVPSLGGASPYAYTNAIRSVLNDVFNSNSASFYARRAAKPLFRLDNRRLRLRMPPFQKQNPPPHGAP